MPAARVKGEHHGIFRTRSGIFGNNQTAPTAAGRRNSVAEPGAASDALERRRYGNARTVRHDQTSSHPSGVPACGGTHVVFISLADAIHDHARSTRQGTELAYLTVVRWPLSISGWLLFIAFVGGSAQQLLPSAEAVVQLRIQNEQRVALGSAVLVHREDGPEGVVLYFVTSERLVDRTPAGPGASEGEEEGAISSDDVTPDLAVLRLRTEKSALVPADMVMDRPAEGASFFIVTHTAAGQRVVLVQQIRKIFTSSATGSAGVPWTLGCVGAAAFTVKGVFGIVSDCQSGKPPRITLLDTRRALLRRLIPGLHLGPDSFASPLLAVRADDQRPRPQLPMPRPSTYAN